MSGWCRFVVTGVRNNPGEVRNFRVDTKPGASATGGPSQRKQNQTTPHGFQTPIPLLSGLLTTGFAVYAPFHVWNLLSIHRLALL
jgi:hypothetical protein